MMGPQLEPAVDNLDNVQMNQVSVPSVTYVVTLEKRIKVVEIVNQNLQQRIMDLEDRMLRITKSPTSSLHTLSSMQHSPMDIMYGLSTFSSSSQATSKEPPRNRTTRTHHDMLAQCHTNECNGMPNAGLKISTIISYANALFRHWQVVIILQRCLMILHKIAVVPSHSITHFVR
jgi:hypothetical protein